MLYSLYTKKAAWIFWRKSWLYSAGEIDLQSQFHQHFTHSFYTRRPQKCQKILTTWQYFLALLGSVRIKGVCKRIKVRKNLFDFQLWSSRRRWRSPSRSSPSRCWRGPCATTCAELGWLVDSSWQNDHPGISIQLLVYSEWIQSYLS